MKRHMLVVVLSVFLFIADGLSAHAAIRQVSGGGAGTLSTAIANAAAGDIIEIQDSLVYTESEPISVQWKANQVLRANSGQTPELNFTTTDANIWAGIAPAVSGVQIGANSGGQIIIRQKSNGYFGVSSMVVPDGGTLKMENIKFTGADSVGRNQWKGSGICNYRQFAPNGTCTTSVDNCVFYDLDDNCFGIYHGLAGDNPGDVVNFTNCLFTATVTTGNVQYVLSGGGVVNIDRCTFQYGFFDIDATRGTVNVTNSIFDRPSSRQIQINNFSDVVISVNLSHCAFWNGESAAFVNLSGPGSGVTKVSTVVVDHCDFYGAAEKQAVPAIFAQNYWNGDVTVTNCNIGVNPQFSVGSLGSQFNGTYSYNNLFQYALSADGFTDDGHNLTVDASMALTPNFPNPPQDWRYTTAGLLTADKNGGAIGSRLPIEPVTPAPNSAGQWVVYQ